jgi:hypothetical protein
VFLLATAVTVLQSLCQRPLDVSRNRNSHSSSAGKDPELGPDANYPPWVFGLADPAPTRQVIVIVLLCASDALRALPVLQLITPMQEISKTAASSISTQEVFQVKLQPAQPRFLLSPPISMLDIAVSHFTPQFLRLERRAAIKLGNISSSKK